jgi:NifU-like protein involved in Fe-S cluster formation
MIPDISSRDQKQAWFYTDAVKEHFFHPHHFMQDESSYQADGIGMVGSPACGDVMKIWIKVDPASDRITDLKWQTFGCASAIASTSMMADIVLEHGGKTIEEARKIKPQDIMDRLGDCRSERCIALFLATRRFGLRLMTISERHIKSHASKLSMDG